MPTVLFVNKVDRTGADVAAVVEQVRRRLTPHVVELARVSGEGGREAGVAGVPLTDESVVAGVARARRPGARAAGRPGSRSVAPTCCRPCATAYAAAR